MPSDITWNQLQTDIGVSGAIQISGSNVLINVSLITGDTYPNLDSVGVIEFARKLLDKCNKTQTRINQGVEVGQRLASFPNASLGTPTKDVDGILRITSTQQLVSRLKVDDNQVTGSQN